MKIGQFLVIQSEIVFPKGHLHYQFQIGIIWVRHQNIRETQNLIRQFQSPEQKYLALLQQLFYYLSQQFGVRVC